MAEKILPGDILFEMIVDVSDFSRNIHIIPSWTIAGETVPKGELGIWKDGLWERVSLDEFESLPINRRPEILTMPRSWAEKLRDELIRQLGDKKADATEQELNAVKFHLQDMRKLVGTAFEVKLDG